MSDRCLIDVSHYSLYYLGYFVGYNMRTIYWNVWDCGCQQVGYIWESLNAPVISGPPNLQQAWNGINFNSDEYKRTYIIRHYVWVKPFFSFFCVLFCIGADEDESVMKGVWVLNLCSAEFMSWNVTIYLHFLSCINFEEAKSFRGKHKDHLFSISWLMMAWWQKEP